MVRRKVKWPVLNYVYSRLDARVIGVACTLDFDIGSTQVYPTSGQTCSSKMCLTDRNVLSSIDFPSTYIARVYILQ